MSGVFVNLGAGVTSINNLVGSISLLGGTGITVTAVGHTLTIDGFGGGVLSINSDTTGAQVLAVGTSGSDFAIVDNGLGTHTFNLPSASATARGLVTTGTQSFAGNKTFTGTISSSNFSGSSSGTNTGDQNLFSTVTPPLGAAVTVNSTSTNLTLSNSDSPSTILMTGNNTSKTVNLSVPGSIVHPTTGSTYEYAQLPPSLTGASNTFIGVAAGDSVTSGSNLNGFGRNVLTAATTASQCYGFGTTLATVTTGSKIIGIGDVIHAALGAQFVLGIGVGVLDTILNSTSGNVGVGFNLLQNTIGGGRNAALGKDIGNGTDISGFAAIGSDVFNSCASVGDTTAVGGAIGGTSIISSSCTYIGNNLLNGGSDNLNGSTIIGNVIANGGSNYIVSSIIIGKGLITQPSTIQNSLLFGFSILSNAGNTSSNDVMIGSALCQSETYTGRSNLILGNDLATGSPAGGYAFTNGIILGFSSAGMLHDATNFVIMGPNTAVAYNTGSGFVAIAESAGNGVIDGSRSIAIGQQTLGSANTIIEVVSVGYACLQAALSCDFTTAVGSYVFAAGNFYEECAAVGYKICETATATNAIHIFALGANSGSTVDTNDNIIMLGNGVEPTSPSSTNEMIVGSSGSPIDSYLWGQVSSVVEGKGFSVKEGSNAKMGVATLVGGTVVVSNTSVTANSRIFLTINTPGGTIGTVYISSVTAATSFTITSSSVLDTSVVAWIIFEPS